MTTVQLLWYLWSWNALSDWFWPARYYRTPARPLQFTYRAKRSADDAINMGLYYILQHLDTPTTCLWTSPGRSTPFSVKCSTLSLRSSPYQPPHQSGSQTFWLTIDSRWVWEKSHPASGQLAMAPPRDSHCIRITSPQVTHLLNSLSLQMTQRSLDSSATVTSLKIKFLVFQIILPLDICLFLIGRI